MLTFLLSLKLLKEIYKCPSLPIISSSSPIPPALASPTFLKGTIVQSSRGLISVLLGAALLGTGWDKLESRVGAAVWMRRAVMALLMVAAITLYAVGKS